MVNLDKIKKITAEKGWSISQLCAKIGKSNSYFNDFKNGKSKISDIQLKIIADVLNTTPEYLKDENDVQKKDPAETEPKEETNKHSAEQVKLTKEETELNNIYRQLGISGKRQLMGKAYELLDKITYAEDEADEEAGDAEAIQIAVPNLNSPRNK